MIVYVKKSKINDYDWHAPGELRLSEPFSIDFLLGSIVMFVDVFEPLYKTFPHLGIRI